MKTGPVTVKEVHIHQCPEGLIERLDQIMATLTEHTAKLRELITRGEQLEIKIGLLVAQAADNTTPEADAALADLEAFMTRAEAAVSAELALGGGGGPEEPK